MGSASEGGDESTRRDGLEARGGVLGACVGY